MSGWSSRISSRSTRPPVNIINAEKNANSGGSASDFHVLIVDLNNFSTFPTLAIGILTAGLRRSGLAVEVLSPLAHDVPAVERERRERIFDDWRRRLHLSTSRWLQLLKRWLGSARSWWLERPHPIVLREASKSLDKRPGVVLLSAYLQHFRSVSRIAALASSRNIPVIVGGPMFSVGATAAEWGRIPGVTAVVGAEVDRQIAEIVRCAKRGESLSPFPGVTLAGRPPVAAAAPLRTLDENPIPDFSDFPWDRYRIRIVPMMTGRGCQWDKCVFCSDVVSVSGRQFRTRSVESVLREAQEQARRHSTSAFLFLDLKLNSNPAMMRGIANDIQTYVRGAEWVGTVHVDLRKDNGLSRSDLFAAARGGMRRISFGLETGSQSLLDRMRKGSSVEGNSEFVRNAHEAGLSVRCTMFRGFPGETAADMEETAAFLQEHAPYIDRVRFNEFSVYLDTPAEGMISPDQPPVRTKKSIIRARHNPVEIFTTREYRCALRRALRAVYEINRKPIRMSARQFDGLM